MMERSNDTSPQHPGVVRVLAHSTAPARSNVCTFQVHCQPDVLFCAYALDGGTIVVQQVRFAEGLPLLLSVSPLLPSRARVSLRIATTVAFWETMPLPVLGTVRSS